MPAKLTPEMKQAFIKWIDKNPEAVFDLIADPGLFAANYEISWAYIENMIYRGQSVIGHDLADEHFAWDGWRDLEDVFFSDKVKS